MATIGLSEYLANAWLGTLRNVPFTVPITCIQLHDGHPGALGTSNVSEVTSRKAMTFSAPDDGATEATGEPAQWDMTDPETISHISVWSGFDGDVDAKYLFPAALKAPRIVVEGDVLILTANDIEFPNLAAA